MCWNVSAKKVWVLAVPFLLLSAAAASSLGAEEQRDSASGDGMVFISGGEFLMGGPDEEDRSPVHAVYVDSFYMDAYEVTNAQYFTFCEKTGRRLPEFWGMREFRSGLDFPNHPVVGVTQADAGAYAEWAGKRLPTEAEWEYAARGGLAGKEFPNGDDLTNTEANYKSSGIVRVGSYPPNGYGLYDMAGNVREWVSDYWDKDYYKESPYRNPKGPEGGSYCVVRDGGWHSGKMCNRVNSRIWLPKYWVDFAVGFRCARDAY